MKLVDMQPNIFNWSLVESFTMTAAAATVLQNGCEYMQQTVSYL